jgi:hypothetical protein
VAPAAPATAMPPSAWRRKRRRLPYRRPVLSARSLARPASGAIGQPRQAGLVVHQQRTSRSVRSAILAACTPRSSANARTTMLAALNSPTWNRLSPFPRVARHR